jgi:glycosyltransferase involved in cell wall biosynthesis
MTTPIAAISVVIPAYRAAAVITPTLESVLAQTHPPAEIIVVDDGSPDDTAEVVAQFAPHVRCIRKPNGGVSAARNAGFAASSGQFVLFLDQDDLITPTHLEKLHAALVANPAWGVAYSAWSYIDETGQNNLGDVRVPKSGQLQVDLVLRNVAVPSTGIALMRREVVTRVGGYDADLTAIADLEILVRIARAGYDIGYVDGCSFLYRISPDSMSANVKKQEDHELAMLDKIYAGQPVPAPLAAVKDEAYAIAYYEAAARYYRTHQTDLGKDRLEKAIQRCPKLASNTQWLTSWVAFNAMSPRTANPRFFMDAVFGNLPSNASTLRRIQNTAYGNYHIQSAFQAYRQQRYKDVVPHLWPGMRGNPEILRNRGFLSLSIKSLLRRA